MALVAEVPSPINFREIASQLKACQSADLDAVNAVILEHLASSVPLIPEVAAHLIGAGGKRLRPLLTLASARLCGGTGTPSKLLAGAVELIHAATLLHDDVVDDSDLRRGLKTANVVFGNKESVLVGDFLFARAFELMVKTNSLRVLDILSKASCTISEGEVLQLEAQKNTDTSRQTYLNVVSAKTAALFAAATQAGAVVSAADEAREKALYTYGLNFGIAYQLVDDALDYASSEDAIGKNTGDDFREGKMTLPVILAIEKARSPEETAFWLRTIAKKDQNKDDFPRAVSLMLRDQVIDTALTQAHEYAEKAANAMKVFAPSPMRRLLEDLALSSALRRA